MRVSIRQQSYRIFIAVISFLLLGTNGITSFAQETHPDRGSSLGSSYSVGQFDTINTTNGNLMLNFPLAVLPKGRGQASAGMYLMYNSKLYDKRVEKILDERYPCDYQDEGIESCTYYYKTLLEPSAKGGWTYGSGYGLEFENRLDSYNGNLPNCVSYGSPNGLWTEMTYIHKLYVVFPDGTRHELHPQGHNDAGLSDKFYRVRFDGVVESCGFSQYRTGSALSYYSDDGSYLRLDVSYDGDYNANNNTWTLYFPDGSKVTSAGYIYDRNGNYVNGLTDDVGRSISGGGLGFEGADLDWAITWKEILVNKTYQSCESPCPSTEERSTLYQIFNVVDTLTEPAAMGGRTYTFTYNAHPYPSPPGGQSDGWGEVSGIALPTGADIEYEYDMDGDDGPSNGLPHDVQVILDNHPVTKNLIYDGSTPYDTWTYSTTTTGSSSTGPDGGSTDYFYDRTDGSWWSGLTYKTEYSNGTKVDRIWAQNKPNGDCGYHKACNPYVKTEYTSIKSGGSYALTSANDYTYDKNGNVTEIKEYDWMPYSSVDLGSEISSQGGLSSYLKRKTLTSYYNDTPTASSTTYNDADSYYLTSNKRLLRLPKSVEVQDSSSTPKARSEMDYDYENYDSSNTKAGNLTETKTWDSFKGGSSQSYSNPLTGTNAATTTATYNSYGMPLTTVDANGVTTSVTYGAISTPGSPVSNLYPTQIEVAPGTGVARTTTMTPDFFTGLVKQTIDTDNGNLTTNFDYDDIGRVIQVNTGVSSGLESRTLTQYS